MTYADLMAALKGWLRRPDLEQALPDFVALCEAQLDRRLSEAGVLGAEVRVRQSLADEYVGSPLDLQRPLQLVLIDEGRALEHTSSDRIAELAGAWIGRNGRPRCFSLVGREIRLHPVPDRPYAAELVYQAGLEPVSLTNPTNWILAGHPDVYLYGALLQAGAHLDEAPRLTVWSELFISGLDALIASERAKRGAGRARLRTDFPTSQSTHDIRTGD